MILTLPFLTFVYQRNGNLSMFFHVYVAIKMTVFFFFFYNPCWYVPHPDLVLSYCVLIFFLQGRGSISTFLYELSETAFRPVTRPNIVWFRIVLWLPPKSHNVWLSFRAPKDLFWHHNSSGDLDKISL